MSASSRADPRVRPATLAILCGAAALCLACPALAHDVAEGDRAFVRSVDGPALLPFAYLGAKHMVTGYDHVAFLIGVVFYLRRLRDVAIFVSLFTLGHSTTLLAGVMLGTSANAHVVDAVIGLSVVYKAAENLGAFDRLGWALDPRLAVLGFGLVHGLGLATKVQDLQMAPEGKLANLVAFNVGVEVGQLLVLTGVLLSLGAWRHSASFKRWGFAANIALVAVGMALTAYQVRGYLQS